MFALAFKTKLDSSALHRALWLELLRLVEMEIQRQKEEGDSSLAAGFICDEELQLLATDPRNVVLLDMDGPMISHFLERPKVGFAM